jgi:adenosine kinase
MERAAQVGAGIATLVLEADGPQEYEVRPAEFAERLRPVYGADAVEEIRSHLPV